MTSNPIPIRTRDGECSAYAYRPQGKGPWPAVLMYMDGIGIRPAMLEVGEQKFFARATLAKLMSDTRFFLDYLAAQPDVKGGGIGVTGYCMGGRAALAAAGTYPDRIVACASYHGGRLANDDPDSPHLLAPHIQARVYVAGAIEDASFPDDMKARLEQALSRAGVDHRVETYPAKHGWVLRDTPAYDPQAAERHWTTLVELMDETLARRKGPP